MDLTKDELQTVRSSFSAAMDLRQQFQTDFYEAFFRRVPEVRSLFREDITGQGMRFMSTLKVIVDNAEHPDVLKERYEELAESHRLVGVKQEYFEPMREALIDTLQSTLGNLYTDEIGRAWRKAFDEVAKTMIRTGGIE